MQQAPPDRPFSRGWTVLQTGLALLLWGALVVWLGWLILREIDDYSTANSDNLQWSLSQADVEFLQFRLALEKLETSRGGLDTLRERFDIFYSRMDRMSSGRLFRSLPHTDRFTAPRQQIQSFLDETVPLIDGSDTALIAARPQLIARADAVEKHVRAFSLVALGAFAEVSDKRRDSISRLMIYMATGLMALFLGLTLLAFTLFRLFRLARKRADEVQAAGARMQTIVETSPNAIIVTDETGTIHQFNAAAERIFGYRREEACGRVARDFLIPQEDRDALDHGVFAFAEERRRPLPEERHFETVLEARGGRRFPAELSVDRAEAEHPLYVAYIRDITKWKEAEAQLTVARDRALAGERTKSEFLAVMSHEMRTPLNGLLGTMQLMRDHSLTERQTDLLDRMQSSGRLLLDLVNDVLDLAKFEAGKMQATSEPFSLPRLLEGVVQTAQPLADTYHNDLRWRWIGPPGEGVIGDARRLRQVLLNLIGNALKFTRNGTVEIEAEYLDPDRSEIELRVIDSGIGIAEADLPRIFKDFETLDSSYARETGGTGLGLGIAKRFTRLMGGEIGAESEPGEGSLFWIRLPLAPAPDFSAPAAQAPQQSTGPARALDVLVVEDNEINRFILREMLGAAGHRVTLAENGRVGVDRAAIERFDVILMDISMPVMDGRTATRHIRQGGGTSAETPIIALTAHAFPEEWAQFHEDGMTACLTKPVDRALLMQAIADALAGTETVSNPVAPGPGEDALIDETLLAQLLADLPKSAVDALLARFLDEMERDIALLAQSEPDAPGLAPLAHRCAGSSGTFGAEAMRVALLRIEAAHKSGNHPDRSQLHGLSDLWRRSRAALMARLSLPAG
ncbi:hybrid sensor histidine kinase/response regulator [Salipiger abyssi]|uniref:hybrid sensor histidine kinase/response regulator n=1 Tax=Salipiger abyssi TaxID=1250539 RepID=UPI001A8E8937|nr:PAS domain-containing hybrid sensor histidine kinase/response regulator [Salipiger abyssi]MBN9886944.1 PAS domain S-box protein [Salipiger abyssi]